jgi:hypothetical protein
MTLLGVPGLTPPLHARRAKATVGVMQAQPREGAPGTTILSNPMRNAAK